MSTSFILSLSDVSNYPSLVVGERAKHLAILEQHHFPHPQVGIVTASALEHLAQSNHREQELKELWHKARQAPATDQENKHLQKLTSLLSQLRWPSDLVHTLHEWYHYQAEGKFVKLSSRHNSEEWVSGEVNLVEAITNLWSQSLIHDSRKADGQLFPPLTLEAQPLPAWSGVALSINQFTHAKTIMIHGVQGLYHPQKSPGEHSTWELDPRTDHVIHRTEREQTTIWLPSTSGATERSLSKQQRERLSHLQLTELSRLIHRLKQTQLDHLSVQWQYSKTHGWLITDFMPLEHIATIPAESATLRASGTSLHSGFVEAKLRVINQTSDLRNFHTGEIMVVKELQAAHLPHLTKASGILTYQKSVGPIMLEAINRFGIPTIAHLQKRGNDLITGETVVMKANQGQVLAQATRALRNKTATKLIIDTAYPNQLDEHQPYDGVSINWAYLAHSERPRHFLEALSEYPLLKQTPLWLCLNPENALEWELGLALLKEAVLLYPHSDLRVTLEDMSTPSQLAHYLEEAHSFLGSAYQQFQWWISATSPAHLAEATTYFQQPLAGMSIDWQSIRAHAYGHAADSDQLKKTPQEPAFLLTWLENAIHQIHDMPPKHPRIEHCQSLVYTSDVAISLITTVVEAGCDGIIVPTTEAEAIRNIIKTAENNRLCLPSNKS